ncbi:hypothetical protein [Endozoicomonas arenosclerae]|uniref:hypothetical protein n=1 Tax=Endozoicomonas arenosclerae TaxID=1633495 RepID=UPI0007858A45|nr:hypothetical protein [Endozoicomonas arenosclerae]
MPEQPSISGDHGNSFGEEFMPEASPKEVICCKNYKADSLSQYLSETLTLSPVQPKVLLIAQLGAFSQTIANMLAVLSRVATAVDIRSRLVKRMEDQGYVLEANPSLDELHQSPGLYFLSIYGESAETPIQESLIIQVTEGNMFLMTETHHCFQVYESTLDILVNWVFRNQSTLLMFKKSWPNS